MVPNKYVYINTFLLIPTSLTSLNDSRRDVSYPNVTIIGVRSISLHLTWSKLLPQSWCYLVPPYSSTRRYLTITQNYDRHSKTLKPDVKVFTEVAGTTGNISLSLGSLVLRRLLVFRKGR